MLAGTETDPALSATVHEAVAPAFVSFARTSTYWPLSEDGVHDTTSGLLVETATDVVSEREGVSPAMFCGAVMDAENAGIAPPVAVALSVSPLAHDSDGVPFESIS